MAKINTLHWHNMARLQMARSNAMSPLGCVSMAASSWPSVDDKSGVKPTDPLNVNCGQTFMNTSTRHTHTQNTKPHICYSHTASVIRWWMDRSRNKRK